MQRLIFSSKFLKMAGGACAAICLVFVLSGCTMNMRDQPRYKPLGQNAFFEDERDSRQLINNTVARDNLRTDTHLYQGQVDGGFAETFPFPITEEMLVRGQQRYNIFCAPCHDQVGTGNGMIVRRGFKQPFSFHIDRLQEAPPGYFYSAIANGFGAMPTYATRIPVEDRWMIVAYIQALQLSQHATLADVPADEVQNLK